MSAPRKNKLTQTSGSVIAERSEKVKKTKFEMELKKIVDCFLDGHGNFDSKLVSLKRNLYSEQYIFFELLRVMCVLKEYKILVKKAIPHQKISTLVRF